MDIRDFPELAKKTIMGYHFQRYAQLPDYIPLIFNTDIMPEDRDYWSDMVVAGLGSPKIVAIGQAANTDEFRETWRWYAAIYPYRTAFTYAESLVKRASSAELRQKLAGQGESTGDLYRQLENEVAFAIFNRGGITAGDPAVFNGNPHSQGQTDPYPGFIYDGKPFIADGGASHPLKLDATQVFANRLNATDLDYAGLGTAQILISYTNAIDERGKRIAINPNTLLVPKALENTAEQIIGSEAQTGEGIGNINVFRNKFKVVGCPYLTDAAAWFMGVAGNGVTFYRQGDLNVNVVYDGVKRVYTVDLLKWFGVVVTDWRYWVGSKVDQS